MAAARAARPGAGEVMVCADAGQLPLAEGSVQCCVTSPPYWGLRKYAGAQERVWNPQIPQISQIACAHEWGNEIPGSNRGGSGTPTDKNNRGEGYARQEGRGCWCQRCGAWRGAYGLEPTVEMYVAHTVEVLREVRRVLRSDGVCFWNLGDSYAATGSNNGGFSAKSTLAGFTSAGVKGRQANDAAQPVRRELAGLKPKDLCLIPQRVALAAQADGWWVRSDIIWAKRNPMPESVTDRPTDAYEHILMLTKSSRYYWDCDAVREPHARLWDASNGGNLNPTGIHKHKAGYSERGGSYPLPNPGGRNLRNVWTFPTQPYRGAHFATFPEELPRRCILAATSAKGACRLCGAPWERVTRRIGGPPRGSHVKNHPQSSAKPEEYSGSPYGADLSRIYAEFGYAESRTVGWRPGCACRGQRGVTVPSIVLDPFSGSGTTGRVAMELNRRAVCVDVSYREHYTVRLDYKTHEEIDDRVDYAPLARGRTREVQPELRGLR